MKKIITLVSALSISVAVPAFAGALHHSDKMGSHFSKMDKNGDGVVSQSEHKSFTSKMFKDADKNKDSKLSRDEMEDFEHDHFKQHAHRQHDRDYDDMNPSAGPSAPQFGSSRGRVYDSQKSSAEFNY